jgi:hypothetical protein
MSIYEITTCGGSDGLLFDVPDCDLNGEWKRYDIDERSRVMELFECFKEMRRAKNLKAGAMSAAMRRAHFGWGWSAKALLNLYRAYSNGGHKPSDYRKLGPVFKAGDWRVLCRAYKGRETVLPEEFKRWLGEQLAQFKGRDDVASALRKHVIGEIWLKGFPVPGYGTVDEWCRRTGRARPHPLLCRDSELPEGWSIDTFRRALPQRETTRKQMAHDYLAAHRGQPDQVLTDRAPLLPLQFVFLDDSRPDFRCLYLSGGRGEIVYPLLVLGLDAATGVDVANVAKPRALKSPEAEDALERKARHGVTGDMSLHVVTGLLRRFGLPPWPITIVHENAAACVPAFEREAMRGLFGERIRFEATGTVKQRLTEYGFSESGGAPYDKAPIEAFWRLLMTQLARLPGSTGPRYDSAPSALKDQERYALKLLERAGGLESVIRKLDSGYLLFEDAHAAIEQALRLFRFRTNHALQGFTRVTEFRRSPAENYRPIAELPLLSAADQDAIARTQDKDAIISRLECPAERFCRLLQGVEMTPVDDDVLVWLEGPRFPVRVRDGKISLKREALGDDLAIFREVDHPLLCEENEGREYEAALPKDGGRIVLTDKGRILGSVTKQERVCRADVEAVRREQGRVAAARKADRVLLADYYLADTNTAVQQLRDRNEAVLAAAPAIESAEPKPAKRLEAKRQKHRADLDAELAQIARDTQTANDTLSQF